MFNDYISDIINSSISAYFDGITKDSLRLSMLSSNFELKNLELNKYALLQHDIPILVDKGIIKSIKSTIPWKSFMTDPLRIHIEDVLLSLNCLCWDDSIYPSYQDILAMKEHQLSAHEIFKSKFKSMMSVVSQSFLKSMYFGFSSKAKVQIDRINIRIRFGNNTGYVVGVQLGRLVIDDPKTPTSDAFCRSLIIANLGFYLDKDTLPIDCDSISTFNQQMNNSFNENHSWIMPPQMVLGTIIAKDQNSDYILDVKLNDVAMQLFDWQLEFLLTASSNYFRFMRFWKMKSEKRPNLDDAQGLWNFVHQAASKNNQINSFSSFPQLFKKFRLYIKHWKGASKKPSSDVDLVQIELGVPYRNIIIWRMFAEKKASLWLRKSLKAKDINEILDFCNIDGQLLLESVVNNSHFELLCNSYSASVFTSSDSPGFGFSVRLPKISYHPLEDHATIGLSFCCFKLFYGDKTLFESIELSEHGVNAKIVLNTDQEAFQPKVSIDVTSNYYNLYLNELFSIFISPKLESILMKAMKLFNSQPSSPFSFILNVNTSPSQVFINMNKNHKFLFLYESLIINTIYILKNDNHYSIKLNKGSFSYGDKQDFPLIDDLSFSSFISKTGAQITLKPIFGRFNYNNIGVLMESMPAFQSFENVGRLLPIAKQTPNFTMRTIIPSIRFDLFLPSIQTPQTINVSTVNIFAGTNQDCITLQVDKIDFSSLLLCNNIVATTNLKSAMLNVKEIIIRPLPLLSMIPKDIFRYIPLKSPSLPFSADIDLIRCEIILGGKTIMANLSPTKIIPENEKIGFISMIQNVIVGETTIIEGVPCSGYSMIQSDILMNLQIDSISLSLNPDLVRYFSSISLPINQLIPENLVMKTFASINSININDYVKVNGINLYAITSSLEISGSIDVSSIDMVYCSLKSSSLATIQFDLFKKQIGILVRTFSLSIDTYKILPLLQILSSLEIDSAIDGNISIEIQPIFIIFLFPCDMISLNIQGSISLDASTKLITGYLDNVKALFNRNFQLLSIPKIEFLKSGQNCVFIERFFSEISIWNMLRLVNLIRTIPSLDFSKIIGKQNPISFDCQVKEYNIIIRQQTSHLLGPAVLILSFKSNIISVVENKPIVVKCAVDAISQKIGCYFEEILSIESIDVEIDLFSKPIINRVSIPNEIKVAINETVSKNILSCIDFDDENVPDIVFTNDTGFPLFVKFNSSEIFIDDFSSSFSRYPINSDEIVISLNNEYRSVKLSSLVENQSILLVFPSSMVIAFTPMKRQFYFHSLLHITNKSNINVKIGTDLLGPYECIFLSPCNNLLISFNDKEFYENLSVFINETVDYGEYCLMKEFNSVSMFYTCSFSYNSVFVNELPFSLLFEYTPTESYILYSNSSSSFRPCIETYKIKIIGLTDFVVLTNDMLMKVNEIAFPVNDGETIFVRVIYSITDKKIKILFVPFGTVFNSTGIPIEIRNSIPSSSIKNDNLLLYHPMPSTSLYDFCFNEFSLCKISRTFFVKSPYSNDYISPIVNSYPEVSFLPISNEHSFGIPVLISKNGNDLSIKPIGMISNQTSKRLIFWFTSKDCFELGPGECQTICYSSPSLDFTFCLSDVEKSRVLNFMNVSDQLVEIENCIISISIRSFYKNKVICFQEFGTDSPYIISNHTCQSIKMSQVDFSTRVYVIPPMSSISYIIPNYDIPRVFCLSTSKGGKLFIDVEIPRFESIDMVSGLTYDVELVLFGGSHVRIKESSSSIIDKIASKITMSVKEINIGMALRSQKLCSITLSKFDTITEIGTYILKNSTSMQNMTIYDEELDKGYQRIFSSKNEFGPPLLRLDMVMRGLVRLDEMKAILSDYEANLDLSLISKIIRVFNYCTHKKTYIMPYKFQTKSKNSFNGFIVPIFQDIFVDDPNYMLMKLIPKDIMSCISTKRITVNSDSMEFSIIPTRERVSPLFISFIPEIAKNTIHFESPLLDIKSAVPLRYSTIIAGIEWKKMLSMSLNTIMYTELFGSIKPNFDLYRSSTNSFASYIINFYALPLSIFESMISYFGRLLHIILTSESYTKVDGVLSGLIAMLQSISSSFGAIKHFSQTYQPSSLAKAALYPISGICDLIDSILVFLIYLRYQRKPSLKKCINESEDDYYGQLESSNGPIDIGIKGFSYDRHLIDYTNVLSFVANERVLKVELSNQTEQLVISFEDEAHLKNFSEFLRLELLRK